MKTNDTQSEFQILLTFFHETTAEDFFVGSGMSSCFEIIADIGTFTLDCPHRSFVDWRRWYIIRFGDRPSKISVHFPMWSWDVKIRIEKEKSKGFQSDLYACVLPLIFLGLKYINIWTVVVLVTWVLARLYIISITALVSLQGPRPHATSYAASCLPHSGRKWFSVSTLAS